MEQHINTARINNNLSVAEIEQYLTQAIAGKHLWGDIQFSLTEYEVLRQIFERLIRQVKSIETAAKTYPVSFTTLLVFLTRYKFNTNFWGLLSNELSVSISHMEERALGEITRASFKKYGFDYSDVKDERRVNIEPIIYEAGLPPESCLDDLFYILNYDTHSIFDPELFIEDLTEKRSYQIRKPMLKFFNRLKDRAAEYVLEVRDAMLCVEQGMQNETRYAPNYSAWKTREQEKDTIRLRKNQDNQTKPYLAFENGKFGLCLVLPRVLLKDEWISEVDWVINNGAVVKHLNVLGDDGRRFIDSLTIPIGAAPSYCVDLIDSEQLDEAKILSWTIDGIANSGVALFNANGRMIAPKSLPTPFATLVMGDQASICASIDIEKSMLSYPTSTHGYSIMSIIPNGPNASITINCNGAEKTIAQRKRVELGFTGITLLNIDGDSGNNLFVQPPTLTVQVANSDSMSEFYIHVGRNTLCIDDFFVSGEAQVSLSDHFPGAFSGFGTYSIRLYQSGNFIRQSEFTLLPAIRSDYYPDPKWYEMHEPITYKFKKQADVQMEFLNCSVTSDDELYRVECPIGVGAIKTNLEYNCNNVRFTRDFELITRPCEYELTDSSGTAIDSNNGRYAKLGLEQIIENGLWLSIRFFGQYKTQSYCLKLHSENGFEQIVRLPLSQFGSCNIDLAVFTDTLNACPLPARIELWRNGSEDMLPLVVISDKLLFSAQPVYQENQFVVISADDDHRDLNIQSFWNPDIHFTLLYKRSGLSKNGKKRGYKCRALDSGLYIVDSTAHQDIFTMDDAESYIELSDSTNIMYVSPRERSAPIACFSDWLDQLIKDVIASGMSDIVGRESYRLIDKIGSFKGSTISELDFQRMIALAYFADSKCSEAKRNSLKRCMEAISECLLDSSSRIELIRKLADHHCNAQVFEICLLHYHLILFSVVPEDAIQLAEKAEEFSTELSLLIRLHARDSVHNTLFREKYRSLVGNEAIRAMLHVPGIQDPVSVANEQRAFLREQPSRVKVCLSPDVSGEMEPIRVMIKDFGNKIVFDKSAKPDIGVYFGGIRYVDQYVNWYCNNSTGTAGIKDEIKALMNDIVSKHGEGVVRSYEQLMESTVLKKVMKKYQDAISARFSDDPLKDIRICKPARFFYLQGLAAFLATLPTDYQKYGWALRAGTNFMVKALKVAPKMARRDILMASVYTYLIIKEKPICQ